MWTWTKARASNKRDFQSDTRRDLIRSRYEKVELRQVDGGGMPELKLGGMPQLNLRGRPKLKLEKIREDAREAKEDELPGQRTREGATER